MTVRKRLVLLTVAALMSSWTLSACGSSDDSGDKASPKKSAKAAPKPAKPDLSGVPEVVAVVDGKKIGKDEFVTSYGAQFQQASTQAQSTGQPVDQKQLRKQTAESLVDTRLLLTEAEDRGYKVSQADRDKTLKSLAKQNGLKSPAEVVDALGKQGFDKAEVDQQLNRQVKLDRLVAEEGSGDKPTEKELRKLYADTVAQQQGSGGAEVPKFDEVRPQLEEQVKLQQQNTTAQALVKDLRKGADIKINL